MLKLTSPAFTDGGPIPRAHTCDGADTSPPLTWSEAPTETVQWALVMDDPDAPAGLFVHWVLYGLPGSVTSLPSGVPRDPRLTHPSQALQGINDFRRSGYGGPCPPPGPAHGYRFTLYALDAELTVPPGASAAVLTRAAKSHVVEEARLIGRYGRTKK